MEEIELYYLRKNRNIVILILFMVLMVVVNIFAVTFYVPYPYVESKAQVIEVSDVVWYEFTVNDNEVYRQSTDKVEGVQEGDSVTIYYHEDNPTLVRFTHLNIYYQNIILIALAIIAEVMVVLDAIYVFAYFRY